jgi:hypothetical protein
VRSPQSRLKAFAPLVVAGTLILTASAATGLEPSPVRPIPDSAFEKVVAPPAPTPTLTPDLRPLADPAEPTDPPARPQPSLPVPKPIVKPVAPIVKSVAPRTAHSISGRASWYCNYDNPSVPHSICHNAYPDGPGFDAYAAAGPGLRAAIGSGWRNRVVTVCGRTCVSVRLVDWCKCTGGSVGVEKLIDLYEDVYARTGSRVTIRW